MRDRGLLFLVFLVIGGVALFAAGQERSSSMEAEFSLSDLRPVTPDGLSFLGAKWSPDSRWLVFATEGYHGLYLVGLENGRLRELINKSQTGYRATWSHDGNRIYFQQRDQGRRKAKSITLDGGATKDEPGFRLNSLTSGAVAEQSDESPFVYFNPDSMLVEARTSTGRHWIVTKGEGPFYSPVLSPDSTKVAVHTGPQMQVFAVIDGKLLSTLGRGLATGWSPDSQYVLYFVDEGDGHQITHSEIFVSAADGTAAWQLTKTADRVEMWPAWSPDGEKIAFTELKSGRIYVGNIQW